MVEHRKPEDRDNAGRDHHPNAYSMWMAGGGIQGGQVVGKTDDFCLNITEDPVHIHDLQATILHCLGFDHTRSPTATWGASSDSPMSPATSSTNCWPSSAAV